MADPENEARLVGTGRADNNLNRADDYLTRGYAGAAVYEEEDGIGQYAGAGFGLVKSQAGDLQIEGKGPNVAFGMGSSKENRSMSVFCKAEVASVSNTNGPVKATLGLAADTGATIGASGVEVKLLGTGVSIGRKMGVSLFGSGVEFNLW